MTPQFAQAADIKVSRLKTPVVLQLGTVGSRSTINFGVYADTTIGSMKSSEYYDIVNLDHFDMVIGVPLMRKKKIILDFDKSCIWMNGESIPAMQVEKDEVVKNLARHRASRPTQEGQGKE